IALWPLIAIAFFFQADDGIRDRNSFLVTGGVAAYGAVFPRSQLFGPTIYRTNSPRKLAITFDDGPNPAITPQLLDLLDRYQAKATFFLIGRFVRECPDLAKETVARG